jgi:catechol 2,3-dioxygenase-like lactoylglutathione lyase family enzyme
MKLKNVLVVVDDMEESVRFYQEMFGLQVIMKQEGNTILSEGLVLQDVKVWVDDIGLFTTPYSNTSELYFEDNDVEGLVDKLTSSDILVRFQTDLTELGGGQKMVRFYDPSGNLIEVRTPINYN